MLVSQPRKVFTAAQMREVDRRTIELGIPGLILMENAAQRVVEFMDARFSLQRERILIFCGKGNNGGDGLAIARQLLTRFASKSLAVLLAFDPAELTGDAATNYRMLLAAGGKVSTELDQEMRAATLIVDALLGTGLRGPARGRALEWIREINQGFSGAQVVAVDVPSGMPSDSGAACGEFCRANYTVTFTGHKYCHVLAPNCRGVGELWVAPIGSPPSLYENDAAIDLALIEPRVFRSLLAPRDPAGNKGTYGHALVVAGSRGKTGAAAMSGSAALRAGAGLVTVASPDSALLAIALHSPELMTEGLAETASGAIDTQALAQIEKLAATRTVLAIGPGIGTGTETASVVRGLFGAYEKPMIVDADALNVLASGDWPKFGEELRILTPHPGEMARLTGTTVKEVQSDRLGVARRFAVGRNVTLVLKGERTLVAFPDGAVWVNPTGSPAMATGGTGDILTGLIAGMLAQFSEHPREAVAAAVWLHGRAGEIGAREIGEQAFIATDLLRFLPQAIREAQNERLDDSHLL